MISGTPSPTKRAQDEARSPVGLHVIRRTGATVPFDPERIARAMTKAFLAVEGTGAAVSNRVHDQVAQLTAQVVAALARRLPGSGAIHIEDIQDQVELALMRAGEHRVARAYVLYREERARARAAQAPEQAEPPTVWLTDAAGNRVPLDVARVTRLIEEACADLEAVDPQAIFDAAWRTLFDGASEADLNRSLTMAARALVEREPAYSQVAARLLLDALRREALAFLEPDLAVTTQADMARHYAAYFAAYVRRAVALERLDPRLATFDLARLGAALRPERDLHFAYLGLQTLHDRYFVQHEGTRFELPQAFFMRVAMGLALAEPERETRAIEFYEVLSRFEFMSSTPTLFNAGTLRPQLSSCYLTTVPDDLAGIFDAIKDNALLSKFAGGLGNDWTPVRGMGARIKSTNGQSQGVVPFLKVANDTAIAVNQCLAPDTLLWTSTGIAAIRDIRAGDLVLSKEGHYREVVKRLVYNQRDPMVEITTEHASPSLRITAGHPVWSVAVRSQIHTQKPMTALLDEGLLVACYRDAGTIEAGDYLARTIPKEIIPIPGFAEEDARFYGIVLGAGQMITGEWHLSVAATRDECLDFVACYLRDRGILQRMTRGGANAWRIAGLLERSARREATAGHCRDDTECVLPFVPDDWCDARGAKRIAPRLLHLPVAHTEALIHGLLATDALAPEASSGASFNPMREGLRYLLLRLGLPDAAAWRQRSGTAPAADGYAASWFVWRGAVFTRIARVVPIDPVPFVCDLKVEGDPSYNTVVAAVANGGKRKGAVCAYLETWHIDIEEFLELRKNTGDDRRRCHDMNTAHWVPDLFMKRVLAEGEWTLFSPDETPDLHELTGQAFERAYLAYEARAARGELRVCKRLPAVELWRKMLTMLFETGHPWITFKDPCNLRYSNRHVGTVHSSNLCTEITLHTDEREIAVCNLGSVNLAAHITDRGLDIVKLRRTVRTALRMLDNAIDINFYNVERARESNLRHRPVGLGLMGFQDALYRLRLPYASMEAVQFADRSMEYLSYYAIEASVELAEERGSYSTYPGSLWSQGILPLDSIELLARERGGDLQMDRASTLDWERLRARVSTVGMRNSNCLAIAPTATIGNIVGVSPSIEPTYRNLFVKSNLSGEFTAINPYLVADLKARDLWDPVMINDLKYHDGSVQPIARIPDELKRLYATAFEIDPRWLVEAASRRQKWLDQAQSLNLYLGEPSGRKLDALYKLAWVRGLKTTYYLRTLGATQVEKATLLDPGTPRRLTPSDTPALCGLEPGCDVCQ